MIISTICNRNLLFIDKQFLNILKTKNQLKKSVLNFTKPSACGYKELNTKIIVSEMSLSLQIIDDTSNIIYIKPLDVDRSTYYCNDIRYNINQAAISSTSLNLALVNSIQNFERILNVDFGYNSSAEIYTLVITYLEKKE